MWGFQGPFRHIVEHDLRASLEAIGVTADPTVLLIGLRTEDGAPDRHPLCIEPEDGPIVLADFDGLHERAAELYAEDPERRIEYSAAPQWIQDRKEYDSRGRAYATAIGAVLETKLRLQFFVALPVVVEDHFVFTALGLPEAILDNTPRLATETTVGRVRVTRSLVEGVITEILRLGNQALHQPYAGADLGIGAEPADIAKAAGAALTSSAVLLAGSEGSGLFDGLNRLATTRYERRVGVGSLLIALGSSDYVETSVTLREPVGITETRTLRKLLETSSRDNESLLADGRSVYGLGRLRTEAYLDADEESVFKVLVTGDGTWELHHADTALAVVEYGIARLPLQQLQRSRLDDICSRVFTNYDIDVLWELAEEAKKAEHGTMLVVSAEAGAEAIRLERQAIPVEPTRLTDTFVRQVTGIDGAVLVDPSGYCHAIGVILDGTASSEGDRARGARYNSALKYLASAGQTPTVILLVSEDGMINLLPDLPSRIRRADRDAMLADLKEAAGITPVDGERFYKAYRKIEANEFYFSRQQLEEVNALMDDHWARRIEEGGNIRAFEKPLSPDPKMTDDYLID